jgi:hypothetical protein
MCLLPDLVSLRSYTKSIPHLSKGKATGGTGLIGVDDTEVD